MWVFYFISNKRIGQLAAQINPNILIEKVRKNEIGGEAELEIEIKTGKLLDILGIAGAVSGNVKGDITRVAENKFKVHEESVANNVYLYLKKRENYTEINAESKVEVLKDIKHLIHFKGYFKPLIEGANVSEMITNYFKTELLYWEGQCGIITVRFLTTKDSVTSTTPVVSCFYSDKKPTFMDGFGTLFRILESNIIEILPLFIGLDLN